MEHLENIFHSGTSYSPLMTGKYFVKETCKLLENYAKKGFKIPESILIPIGGYVFSESGNVTHVVLILWLIKLYQNGSENP